MHTFMVAKENLVPKRSIISEASTSEHLSHGSFSDFRWVKGEELVLGTPRRFCSQCGSPVPAALKDPYSDWLVVPAGCLEDVDLDFKSHIFVRDKAPWYEITDDLLQHEQGEPEGP